jgi:hypothetical protein
MVETERHALRTGANPWLGQWRRLGDRLFRRLRAVSVRHRSTSAAHRIVRAVVPLHPRADGRDGHRRDDGTGTFRQGAERDYCVRVEAGVRGGYLNGLRLR